MAKVVEFLKATGGSTWTVPAGVTSVRVDLIAAGSNGASGSNANSAKGGSGGGYAYKQSLAVTPGAAIPYYISAPIAAVTGVQETNYFKSEADVAATTGWNIAGGTRPGGDFLAGDGGNAGGASVNGRTGGGGAAAAELFPRAQMVTFERRTGGRIRWMQVRLQEIPQEERTA